MIAGTAPDEQLYPDYQLDDLRAEPMIEETNFSVSCPPRLARHHVVASGFAMLNERLARHYGIDGGRRRSAAGHTAPTVRGGC
jgi:hypothetical protein